MLSVNDAKIRKTSAYAYPVTNAKDFIDLRSDTITQPSAEMRRAMANSVVGDDVYGEDPTVKSLEDRCARLFGKEAALFVVTGTMGNLLAVLAHCQRGDEIIMGRQNHLHRWEQGCYAQLAGVAASTLEVNEDGLMSLKDIEDSIRVKDFHMPVTRMISIENTHNYCGGKALPMDYLRKVKDLAERNNIVVHMDGSRVYNAAIALDVSVADIAEHVDSLQMCFSKGMGAPLGSILVGTKQFIDTARTRRKALGGGWRQAGVLAAAAHIGLDRAEETLRRDHERTIRLAREINEATPEHLKHKLFANENNVTNMCIIHCLENIDVNNVVNFFKDHGVLMAPCHETRIRIVLNWGVNDDDLEKVVDVYRLLVASIRQ